MYNNEESLILRALGDLILLLAGGNLRPHAVRNIRARFNLPLAICCPTQKSAASPRSFESKLYTPRLALVVCARGLTRTQHGRVLREMCRKLGLALLDSNHNPHPNVLIAAVVGERFIDPVLGRYKLLKPGFTCLIGGAA